jgi:hypothetical protein
VQRDDNDELTTKLAATTAELAEVARLEHDVHDPGSDNAALYARMLPALERLACETREALVLHQISQIEQERGAVPESAEELAVLIGTDIDTVRRVLAQLDRGDLA